MRKYRPLAVILVGCGAILVVTVLAYLFASRHAGIARGPGVAWADDGGENEERVTLTHQRGSVVLNIESGRPLASAAEALMHEYANPISYEDPRYENADDLVDISAEVRKDGKSGAQDSRYAVWVPKTRRAVIVLPEPKSQSDISAALAKVASAFGGRGGQFDVQQSSGIVHVVPRGIRDKNGNWTYPGSVLDSRISIPKELRTDDGLLNAICEAVSAASGVKVVSTFRMLGGLVVPPSYELGADNEPARDVLIRALTVIGHGQLRYTWHLFYGSFPTDNSYAMNFSPVPVRAEVTERQPVDQVRPQDGPTMGIKQAVPGYWHH
jgi:hypothetical protein